MLSGVDGGGSESGDLKEMRFMAVLFGESIYHMLARLWIPIFDFYTLLHSRQIIYLNILSVVRSSFDWRALILHNREISTC